MVEPTPSSARARWRSRFLGLVLLGWGAAGAYEAAQWSAPRVERWLADRVETALAAGGFGWARVTGDGLTVRLEGTAPDPVAHVRAVATATGAAAFGRIEDAIAIPPPAGSAPPSFRIEVLRNEQGTSVIGLAPRDTDREELIAELEHAAGPGRLTDLVELTELPAPEGWQEAVAFALQAAVQMPRAKVSVTPGQVRIDAVTDGQAERARLEQALAAAAPEGVTLVTNITAPRPVIAPFALELVRTPEGTRLNRCAADNEAERDRILSAAARAGAAETGCDLGLGAPSPQWEEAALAGISALDALPAGRMEISGTRVTLTAPHDVPQPDFATARDRLAQALPRAFTLTAMLDPAPETADPSPLRFDASLKDGGVRLQGAIPDDSMGAALESLASARFGPVESELAVRGDTPPGWTARIMAAVEAMDGLQDGAARVTPDLIRLSGTTGSPTAAQAIADRLGARLGSGAAYELALIYDPRLDPAVDLPSGEDCVDALNTTMQQSPIGFEPDGEAIAGDAAPVIEALAATMQRCAGFRIEIGGHTDSQGADSINQDLSAARARAVLAAMAKGGIDTANLAAVGYGESRPLAPNDTEAGREANRRIEFRLISPHPVNERPAAPTLTRGVTGGPAPAPPTPAVPAADAAGPVPATGDTARTGSGPTPDEVAASKGISIRPETVTRDGARLTTPVPPPLVEGPVLAPEPEPDGIRRPRARPEE